MGSNYKLSYLQILPSSVHHASLWTFGHYIYVTYTLNNKTLQLHLTNLLDIFIHEPLVHNCRLQEQPEHL